MCQLCKTKPVYEFTNQRKLCRTCYVRWFEKKVLYTNRKFKLIKKGDRVAYNTQGCTPKNIQKNIFTKGKKARGFREIVLEHVLQMFVEKSMVELVEMPGKKKADKIAVASTTDLEAEKIIHTLIKGNVNDLKNVVPVNNKIIKPLYLFLDEEVLLYARLKRLKFVKRQIKKSKISKFIDELEKKHPEVKRAIVSSYLKL